MAKDHMQTFFVLIGIEQVQQVIIVFGNDCSFQLKSDDED